MSAPILSKAALGEQKALIKSCCASGVGIEGLEGMEGFRFVPSPCCARDKEAKSSYAKPSKRAHVRVKCRIKGCICRKSKWFRHQPIEAGSDYHIPMAGDDAALTKARKAYSEGDPKPLRAWLAKTADKRRRDWAAVEAARACPQVVTLAKVGAMSPKEFATIRSELGKSQHELADLLQVNWRTVYRYEDGTTAIPGSVAILMRLLEGQWRGEDAKSLLKRVGLGTL